MKKWSAGVVISVLVCGVVSAQTPAAHVDHAGLKKLGWQLACQMSAFGDRTVFETLEFLHGQGFHHIELWPGQVLSAEKKEVKVGPGMSKEDIDALQAKLKEVHLDIVSYGPVELPADYNGQEPLRRELEFAKKLKAKNLVVKGTVPEDAGKMAEEYAINLAILGDPPAKLPESKRVGICVDLTGAAGGKAVSLNRPIELHLGMENEAGVLKDLKGINFKGVFAVACHGARGKELEEKFIAAVNTFSDEVTKLAQ